MKKMLLMVAFLALIANVASASCYIFCGSSGNSYVLTGSGSSISNYTWTYCGPCAGGPWMVGLMTVFSPDGGQTDGNNNPIDQNSTNAIAQYYILNNVERNISQEDMDRFQYCLDNNLFTQSYIDAGQLTPNVGQYLISNN